MGRFTMAVAFQQTVFLFLFALETSGSSSATPTIWFGIKIFQTLLFQVCIRSDEVVGVDI